MVKEREREREKEEKEEAQSERDSTLQVRGSLRGGEREIMTLWGQGRRASHLSLLPTYTYLMQKKDHSGFSFKFQNRFHHSLLVFLEKFF